MKQCFFLIILVLFIGCKKNGTGGKASLSGIVAHHNDPIANATVYIKYDAIEFPGGSTDVYDDNVTADKSGRYEIKELLKGEYYLYGVGYDSTFNEVVTGGIPVEITKRKESLTVDLPVTE